MQLTIGWVKGIPLFRQWKEWLSSLTTSEKIYYLFLRQIVNFVFGVAGALFVNLFFFQQVHVGSINITGLVDAFIKDTAKENLSKEEMERRSNIFGDRLNKAVEEISATRNIVLLPGEAVISGGMDYTGMVQDKMREVR